MNRRIRDPNVRWCERCTPVYRPEPPTRLAQDQRPKTLCAHKILLKCRFEQNPNRPPVSPFTTPYVRPPTKHLLGGCLPIGEVAQHYGIIRQLILIFVKVILGRRFASLLHDFRITFIGSNIQIVDRQNSDFMPPGITKVKKVI